MPCDAVIVAIPSDPELQVTSVWLAKLSVSPGISVTVAVTVPEQPMLAVTTQVYVPAERFVAV